MVHSIDKKRGETVAVFSNECRRQLDSLESELKGLSSLSDPEGMAEMVGSASRLFFSIRDKAVSMNLDAIEGVANSAENFLELHCAEPKELTALHIDLLKRTCRLTRGLLENLESESKNGFEEEVDALIRQLEQGPGADPTESSDRPSTLGDGGDPSPYDPEMLEVFTAEALELLEDAEGMLLLLEKSPSTAERSEYLKTCLRHFHTLKGNANLLGIPPLEHMMHDVESMVGTLSDGGGIVAGDQYQLLLETIDAFRRGLSSLSKGRDLDPSEFRDIQSRLSVMSSFSEERDAGPGGAYPSKNESVELWLDSPESPDPSEEREEAVASRKDIRVGMEKLDRLVNLVGELVTVTNVVVHNTAVQEGDREDSIQVLNQLGQITVDLRELAMSMRIVPVVATFRRMARAVRNISRSLGKEVRLTTSGEETEIDKILAEQIADPILHIIRNAIDHGIENPEERQAAGKPPVGSIHLEAGQMGNEVWLTVKDDGRGLDREKILAKARKRGLLAPNADLPDKTIWKAILEPGFSTADEISELSGRGLGMNVVKRNLEKLSGYIEIDSIKGQGTSFRLRLPLTLAIIDTLLVRIAEEYFSVPLSLVKECAELSREDIEKAHGRQLVHLHGEIVPYVRLREQFGIQGDPPDIEQIVIVEQNGRRMGIVVDSALDRHQTIIKSLGKVYADIETFSGATVLGDGTVALILDVPKLMENSIENQ